MKPTKRLVSLVSPCFNEQDNVEELYRRTCDAMAQLPQYDFEYLIIDNASTDRTVERAESHRGPGSARAGSS